MRRVAFEEVEHVPADLQPTHERLINWALWARGRAYGSVCIGSAEGRYRSPQHWHPVSPPIPIDTLDALLIERRLRLIPLKPWRELLKLHYVHRCPPDRACRQLAVRYCDYGLTLNRARYMTRNLLRCDERDQVLA